MGFPYMAVLAAGVAGWVFGAIWYTVLGKAWQAALGMDPDGCKGKKMPLTPLLVALAAALAMAATQALLLAGLGVEGWMRGAEIGLILGLGFLLTSNLVNNMFQQKKPMATVIDAGHWVLVLTLEGAILGALA